jgi:hypothetical protein
MKSTLKQAEKFPIKHDNGTIDKRYRISECLTPKMEKGYDVWFLDKHVGTSLTYTNACNMAREHNTNRFNNVMK